MAVTDKKRLCVWAGLAVSHFFFAAAMANASSNNVSGVVGNGGDVSFEDAQNFAAGSAPSSVALGDFNGDGIADLAVANRGSSDVSVLLGNGDGSFQPASNFGVESGPPYDLVVADFNGDGVQDLAMNIGLTSSGFSVFLGNGDASFRLVWTNFVGVRGASCLAAGDFDGDGLPDLVMAVGYNSVAVFLGNGDGTFQAPPRIEFGNDIVQCVAVADFNGDGVPDLAVTHYRGPLPPFYTSLLLGNGDGTFQSPHTAFGDLGPVAVGDFNGDGFPDLAVFGHYSGTHISVLLGGPDGILHNRGFFDSGGTVQSIAVGDFRGVGFADLALLHPNNLSVALGNGDGSFRLMTTSFGVGGGASSAAVGDFNGDGLPDVAVANSGTNDVSVLINNTTH